MSEKDKLYWLSFTDGSLPEGQRFLGVAIVRDAVDVVTAVKIAHALDINPGGEVLGFPVSPAEGIKPVPEEYIERLLTRADVNALMEAVGSSERF